MPAMRISFAGPGKTPAELSQAVAAGVTVTLESRTEAERVISTGARLGVRPRVAVRVNPDFRVKGSGMRMGGGPQQFGIDAEQVPELLGDLSHGRRRYPRLPRIRRVAEPRRRDHQRGAARDGRARDRARRSPPQHPSRYLNLGGGFGIPYFDRDSPLDLGLVGENLAALLDERIRPSLPEARVVVELGRYIVGECGVYVTRVLDRKVSRGKTFVVVDGGLHHQLAASGNFGQVIRRNYPVAVGNRLEQEPTETVSVVGCLCTPLDLLADDVTLPATEIGDLIVVFQAGAYGLTASPTAFLGHPEPVEVLV